MSRELLEHAVVIVALCSARIAPVTFLCPVLGGPRVPSHVKLALVLAIAALLCTSGGDRWEAPDVSPWGFGLAVTREAFRGLVLGLIANAPFVAARLAGRWIDASRGASAESALPFLGSTDAASGDFLQQLLVAAICATQGLSPFLAGVWDSFRIAAPGAALPNSFQAVVDFTQQSTALGLAIAAPPVVACLVIDGLSGALHRICPELNATSQAAPIRILVGAAVLLITVPGALGRLSDFVRVDGLALGQWGRPS